MFSICSSLRCLIPQWRWRNRNLCVLIHTNRQKIGIVSRGISSSLNDDSVSLNKQNQLEYDPSEDLYGLELDLQPRNVMFGKAKLRSWFGPSGQYVRELPCPSCRGRGYVLCTECGIERSRLDCSQCNGKGLRTCRQCFGDCVIWEESIDELPWEKARSRSPLKVKEDDEVDNLDIKLDATRKSKRIYQSPSPEVGLKISRSLRSLNAKTGLFSKRMKNLHRDPTLRAQRIAAIKKAKGTAAARKQASEALKAYFSDPQNRLKRSLSMKGVKFYCKNCGGEGHRRHYCPLKGSFEDRRYRCRTCGERGHNRMTCQRSSRSGEPKVRARMLHHCRVCGQVGHNSRTCPRVKRDDSEKVSINSGTKTYSCSFCLTKGHNIRTCTIRKTM